MQMMDTGITGLDMPCDQHIFVDFTVPINEEMWAMSTAAPNRNILLLASLKPFSPKVITHSLPIQLPIAILND